MTKRDLLKEPFTEEELEQWILTDEEIELLKNELYEGYIDDKTRTDGQQHDWLEEGEPIDYMTPFMKKYKNKIIKSYPNFNKLDDDKQSEIIENERWSSTIISQDEMDEFHENIWNKKLDIEIDFFMKAIQNKSIVTYPRDGKYYRGCGISSNNYCLGIETICCKSMYKNGTCKPACMCKDCIKTYKNLEEWERKQ